MKFTIAIEPGTKKTAFGIVVPDLPGCFSAGDTVEEAFDNVREIIDAFCQILAEKGKDLPVPKSMSKWQADKEYKGWTWGIVEVAVDQETPRTGSHDSQALSLMKRWRFPHNGK